MDEGPELPSGWVGALLLAIAWLSREAGPWVVKFFDKKREAKESDVKVDVKRAAAESRIKQSEQDHVDARWQRLIDVMHNQIDDLLGKQAAFLQRLSDQDEKIEKLQRAHDDCIEQNAALVTAAKLQEERIAKLERQVPR